MWPRIPAATNSGGKAGAGPGERTPGRDGGRRFKSYAGVHPSGEEADLDGLDQAAGAAYWLFRVEHANRDEQTRELQIQHSVAHARTFTFDQRWVALAASDPPSWIAPTGT